MRVVWVSAGILFFLYMVLSYSARGVNDDVMLSSGDVVVSETATSITFAAAGGEQRAGLVFIPGGMVQPEAYAPLLRAVAEAGHTAVLVRLPSLGGRHAPGEDGRREAAYRATQALDDAPGDRHWVVAGHSLGGHIAALVAASDPDRAGALVLIGTSHPRDFSLADYDRPVVKVYGTRDRIASLEKMQANAHQLPTTTRWVGIEGGNHSQFGYYGFQLGDGRARITREEQQAHVLAVLLDVLAER